MSTYIYKHADDTHEPDISHGHIFGMGGSTLWCRKCGQVLERIEVEYTIHSEEVIISGRWKNFND